MNVAQLRSLLMEHDMNLRIVINDARLGYIELNPEKVIKIDLVRAKPNCGELALSWQNGSNVPMHLSNESGVGKG